MNGAPLRQRRPTRPWEEDRRIRSSHAVGRLHSRLPRRLRVAAWGLGRSPLRQPRSPRLCSRSGRGGTTANKAHKVQGPRPRGRRSRCFLRRRPARAGGGAEASRGWGQIPGPPPPAPVSPGVSSPPAYSGGFRRRPRDPGPALGAAASSPLPVRLCVCVCLAVPELVSTPELSLPDTDSPRRPSPFPWQAT